MYNENNVEGVIFTLKGNNIKYIHDPNNKYPELSKNISKTHGHTNGSVAYQFNSGGWIPINSPHSLSTYWW